MSTQLSTHTKEVVRDPYTERLLTVCYELVKRKALRAKIDLVKALGFNYTSQYNEIEKREANFPPKKASVAEAQLLDKYGVNPSYLKGTDTNMFVWEPQPAKMAVGEGAVRMNFRDKREKEELVTENEALKTKVEHLEALVAWLEAELKKSTPDSKPDKPKKK